jgi:hypothetical protein
VIRLVTAVAACAALLPQAPQDASQDAARERIAAAVAATGLSHEKSASGLSCVVPFEHGGDRRQSVFVAIAPGTAGPRTTHLVYTTVWIGKEPPDDAQMRKVFTQSKKFGAFYLFADPKGSWSIRFGAQLDVTAMPARPSKDDPGVVALRGLIEFVNVVGEEMDVQLNGGRDLR